MSGGGKRVSKGRMGSSVITEVDPKQLEKWESDLEKVSSYLIRFKHGIVHLDCFFTVMH